VGSPAKLALGSDIQPVDSDYFFPVELTAEIAKVTFEVDSTWHVIEGSAKQVKGRVWLDSPGDWSSLRADIEIPVSALDTDNGMRDEKMREVMAAEKYPNVKFLVNGLSDRCDLDELKKDESCESTINGDLTIRKTSKRQDINISVRRKQKTFIVEGETTISWADFGVEDPSIFVAKLDRHVTIRFEYIHPAKDLGL
jgi:polyisoprenoid-binding protein YceI